MNKDDLIVFSSFFIGVAMGFFIPYPQSFFLIMLVFLTMITLLCYFTSKYNLFPGGKWGNPDKPVKKWQKIKGGKFLIFIIYVFIGLIVGFFIKLNFFS